MSSELPLKLILYLDELLYGINFLSNFSYQILVLPRLKTLHYNLGAHARSSCFKRVPQICKTPPPNAYILKVWSPTTVISKTLVKKHVYPTSVYREHPLT
jgi:hypothetical protein